jgi:hypothetical protein
MNLTLVFITILALGIIGSVVIGKLASLAYPAAFIPVSIVAFMGWIFINRGNSN